MSKKILITLMCLTAVNFLFADSENGFEFTKEGTGGIPRVTITKYSGKQSTVRLPERLKADVLNIIGDDAFNPSVSGGPALTSLTFASGSGGLTTIGNRAFANNRLTQLVLPEGVREVGDGAFKGNRITSLTLPGDVGVGEEAFAGNNITVIKIGRNVNLDPSAIGLEFQPYYEGRGSVAGTYTYRSGKWYTEQEIKDQDRLKELETQLGQEQRNREALEKQLEQETQKQEGLRRQIRDAETQAATESNWDEPDMGGIFGIGGFFEVGGDLIDLGAFFNLGLSFRGEHLGLNIQGEVAVASWLISSMNLSASILGMVDLFFIDSGDPGWGLAAGYGSYSNMGDNTYDEATYESTVMTQTFWRFGFRKHNWFGNENWSCLLYVDIAEQSGFRMGFQASLMYFD